MTQIPVKAGGSLQAALDAARPGDEVILEAGATFEVNALLRPLVAGGRDSRGRQGQARTCPFDGSHHYTQRSSGTQCPGRLSSLADSMS
jgi:hypothetical protein